MTRIASILLIAAAVPLLFCAAYLLSLFLVPDHAVVMAEADKHLEHARRLLSRYSHNHERLARILVELERDGVNVAPSQGQIEPLLEQERSLLEEADETLNTRSRGEAAAKLRDLEDRFLTAGGSTDLDAPPPGGFSGSLAQMSRTVASGIATRDALVQENKRLLDEALRVVDQALAVSSGEITGAVHPQASRLKGIILMAQAGVRNRDAVRLRESCEEPRRRFAEAAARVRRLTIERTLAEQSGVRDRLETLRTDADAIRRVLTDLRGQIETLDDVIEDRNQRIASARDTADQARSAMEKLQDDGANLLAPDGFTTFADEYSRLSESYRQAVAEAHRLEFGTLAGARIDDSGDYVHGQFVPETPGGQIEIQRGLVDYQDDRATAALKIERYRESLQDVEAKIVEFETLLAQYTEQGADAGVEMESARQEAADAYRQTLERSGAAAEALEAAVRKAGGAITALKSAVQAAQDYTGAARDRLGNAAPGAQERSPFKLLSEDDWISGQASDELAQAYYLLATILAHRHEAAQQDRSAALLARAELELEQADPDAFADRSESARVDAIEAVRNSINELQKASRDLDNNWTVAAQAGAAHYLLAVLENPAHLETAVGNYQAAVQDREQQPFAQAIVDRKEQLEDRLR